MNARKQNKLDWALQVLNLTLPINEASVIDRMNDVRQSLEDQNSPTAWKALREAQEAGAVLLQQIETDELENPTHETVDPLLYFVSPEAAEAARVKEKQRKTRYLVAGAVVLLIALAFGIPSAIANRKERLVEAVFLLRSTMNWQNYERMERYLDILKDEPRVDSVRADFELIRADLEIWTQMQPPSDPADRRAAYYRLLAFDEARPAWYLMGLLDLNDNFLVLIRESRFESGGVWFELKPDLSLDTNLPASYEILLPYELEISADYRDYVMVNQANGEDRVSLYRIQSVTETELSVYCYFDQQTYVLSRVGS